MKLFSLLERIYNRDIKLRCSATSEKIWQRAGYSTYRNAYTHGKMANNRKRRKPRNPMKKYKGDTLCGGSVTHTQPEKSVEDKNEATHGKRNSRWAPKNGMRHLGLRRKRDLTALFQNSPPQAGCEKNLFLFCVFFPLFPFWLPAADSYFFLPVFRGAKRVFSPLRINFYFFYGLSPFPLRPGASRCWPAVSYGFVFPFFPDFL